MIVSLSGMYRLYVFVLLTSILPLFNIGSPLLECAARGAAKLVGYGWEALGGPKNWGSTDFRHDLNANALGIAQSSKAQDFQSLADQLESFSRSARKEAPPGAMERSRDYFTYTK